MILNICSKRDDPISLCLFYAYFISLFEISEVLDMFNYHKGMNIYIHVYISHIKKLLNVSCSFNGFLCLVLPNSLFTNYLLLFCIKYF